MKTGNKSKYAGDLNEQYSLIKQICDEIEEQEESKDSKKEDKLKLTQLLESTEETILSKKEYGKRKRADGSIVDHSSGKKPKSLTFDDALVGALNSMNSSNDNGIMESTVEKAILHWMGLNGKTNQSLLVESNIFENNSLYDQCLDLLNELGLDTLVNIYCAKGNNFEQKEFKDSMRELGFPPLAFYKFYKVIGSWKESAMAEKCPTSDTSLSTVMDNSATAGDSFDDDNDHLVHLNML